MKKTVFLLLLLASLHTQAQEDWKKSVYFDTDRHELRTDARQLLDEWCRQLLELPDYAVEIEAHTDSRGSETYNLQLAERRAATVSAYMATQGVKVTKTTTKSLGEDQPAFDNDSDEGRQGNRRVDVVIRAVYFSGIDELAAGLKRHNRQTYRFDAGKSVKVTAKSGTQLWVEAGSFTLPDGSSPKGNIELSIEESYNLPDMMLAGLHTTSKGKMLVSGGMIYVEATAGGQPLAVKDGAALQLAMPTNMRQEGMQLFYGAPGAGGNLNDWISTQQMAASSLQERIKSPPQPPLPVMRTVAQVKTNYVGKAPQKPEKPRAFTRREPTPPNRDKIKYEPGFFERIFTSKTKLEAKREAKYQVAVRRYDDRREKYWDGYKSHETALQRYEQQLADYQVAYNDWFEKREAAVNTSQLSEEEKKRMMAQYEIDMKNFNLQMAAWEEARNKRLQEFENNFTAVGKTDAASVDYYFYAVTRLGWINCDLFYNIEPEDQTTLVIHDNDDAEERVFVIFKEMKSIMPATLVDGKYQSGKVPKKAAVKIIGYKVQEGKAYMAVHETVAGEKDSYALHYQPSSLKAIRKELETL
ncbi:MAG: OmpA family protein [Saprospiraceae bacterium]|nr:OmpA family protein [Saprospiraceae bacterium]